MDNFYITLIISAIIQAVTLIVFFVMAANVSAIKKDLVKELYYPDYIEKFEEEKYIGNKTKAKEWLLRLDFNLQKEMNEVKTSQHGDYYKEEHIKTITKQREQVAILLKELE